MIGALHTLEKELLSALQHAGVELPLENGFPSLPGALRSGVPQDSLEIIGRLLCEYTARHDWKAAGFPSFYATISWRELRYKALATHGNRCQCCGASPKTGAVLHVDHVKPRSKYPELSLVLENLQVLCADCNLGKGARDETDWRV